eukprot:scaffold11396_cov58-Attheya_sp.AAC.1
MCTKADRANHSEFSSVKVDRIQNIINNIICPAIAITVDSKSNIASTKSSNWFNLSGHGRSGCSNRNKRR